MKLEYLFFNIAIVFLAVVGSQILSKRRFPQLRPAIIAIIVGSLPFVLLDLLVTGHWWSFNERYILGARLGNLPVEEILFFLSVPWSCLVIWEYVRAFVKGTVGVMVEAFVIVPTIVWAYVSGSTGRWYALTMATAVILVSFLSLLRGGWLRKKKVLVFFSITSGLTLLWNGYLTGRPIVTYNPNVITPIRVGSIPVEDFVFSLLLLGLVLTVYEKYRVAEI